MEKNKISLAGAEFKLYEGTDVQGDAIKLVKELVLMMEMVNITSQIN